MAEINFTPNQIKTMQEDAINRVLEMQRRSNEKLKQSNIELVSSANEVEETIPQPKATYTPPEPSFTPPQAEKVHTPPHNTNNQNSSRNPDSALNLIPDSLFEQFNIDKERAIILLLLFLLIKEKANTPLILALCYILI